MQASICPICGYANFYSSRECINCGTSLSKTSLPGRYIVSEEDREPFNTATADNPPKRSNYQTVKPGPSKPASAPARRRQPPQAHPAQDEENPLAIVPYRGPTLPAPLDGNPYDNPYESSMDIQPYHPQNIPFQTNVKEEQEAIDLEPWKTDRLPWYLPRRRPHLCGKIIHIQNEMEFPDFPNLLRAIADLMSEFLWMAANQPAHKEGERVQVTIIRMRTNEGQLKDARIMGYLRGAHLSLGDVVSFWGWRRRGSLLVRTGYNHTSKATIATNVMSMLLPGLIVLAIIFAIFLFTVYQANIFAFFHTYFHSFGH